MQTEQSKIHVAIDKQGRWLQWAAYGACAWALLFALLSFYWALGGLVGIDTIVSPAIAQLARAHDPLLLAGVWLTAFLKVFAGAVALALLQTWGRRIPSWLLHLLAWGAGTLFFVHGALFLLIGLLAFGGLIQVSMPETTLFWYTWLWGPWWLLGGLLFLLEAWLSLRSSPRSRADVLATGLGIGGALALLLLSGGTIG